MIQRPPARHAALVAVAVAALFVLRGLAFDSSRYSPDALYYFGAARCALGEPQAAVAPDYIGRRHPLFVAALAGVEAALGPSLWALLVLTYASHLVACLLLLRLLRALGLPAAAAFAGASLFAVFPGANNLFADPIHFARAANLALALLALLALVRHRPWSYALLYGLTLLNFEDAVFLPLAGVALEVLVLRRPGGGAIAASTDAASGGAVQAQAAARRRGHLLALALLAAYLVAAALGPRPFQVDPLGIPARAAVLPLEIARQAFVPHSELVPSRWPRYALALAAILPALALRRAGERSLATPAAVRLALLATLACFAAPYVLRPFGSIWPSRYLYFPAAPALVLAATFLGTQPPWARRTVLAFAAAVGLTSTEAAAARIASRHLHPLPGPQAAAVVGAVADRLEGRPQRQLLLPADACAFLARVPVPEPIDCSTSGAR